MNIKKYGKILKKFFGEDITSENIINFEQKVIDTRPCRIPFENFEIYSNGEVYPCCADMLNYEKPAGSILTQSFNEIWNGEMLTDLRQRVLKGDYSCCKRDICSAYEPFNGEPTDYKKGPKEIKICYDFECNYSCINCRNFIKSNTPEELSLYNNVYLPKILDAAANVKMITLSGSGDPLFSRHSKHLIKELIQKYPDIKIRLHTNGSLMNEETLRELGIENNIYGVSVSLDAATPKTYRKIRRSNAFNKVVKNLEMISEWKKQGKIEWITINFVVQILNYEEMPAFVKLARSLDAKAFFTTYRPWQTSDIYKKYDEIAVFEPHNKYYKKLVKILHNRIFKDEKHCSLEPSLQNIAFEVR